MCNVSSLRYCKSHYRLCIHATHSTSFATFLFSPSEVHRHGNALEWRHTESVYWVRPTQFGIFDTCANSSVNTKKAQVKVLCTASCMFCLAYTVLTGHYSSRLILIGLCNFRAFTALKKRYGDARNRARVIDYTGYTVRPSPNTVLQYRIPYSYCNIRLRPRPIPTLCSLLLG